MLCYTVCTTVKVIALKIPKAYRSLSINKHAVRLLFQVLK